MNDTETLTMTRVFDAPGRMVFDALTGPELLRRWMEAPGRRMEVCEEDLRVGGAFRRVWRGPGKKDAGMAASIDAGETLVTTVLAELLASMPAGSFEFRKPA